MSATRLRELAATLEVGLSWVDTGEDELLSTVLAVAHETGAPRSRILRIVADAWDENDTLQREVRIAATSSRTSARILVALPAATAIVSALIGLDTLGFLFSTPTGWLCLVVGCLSTGVGWWWMRRLILSIPTPPLETGIVSDLVGEILSVTSLNSDVLDTLAECAGRWSATEEWNAVLAKRDVCRETGTPIVGVLRALASDLRRTSRLATREKIEALPARLLVPLGVCLFPAFIVLTVIPAVATMAGGFFAR